MYQWYETYLLVRSLLDVEYLPEEGVGLKCLGGSLCVLRLTAPVRKFGTRMARG